MSGHNTAHSLTKLALWKFKKDFRGVFCFCFLLLVFLAAALAYVLAPDKTENANRMHLSIHSQKPGFTVQMLTVPAETRMEEGFLKRFFFGKNQGGTSIPISGYTLMETGVEITEYAGQVRHFYTEDFPGAKKASDIPSMYIHPQKFLLGTDRFGRDLLSRMLIGARVSVAVGFVAVFISLLIGISLGAVAGYFGGKTDAAVMWLINVTWSIPTLLMVIAITLALGKGFWQVFVAVGLTMWVEVARVVRGQVMSAGQMEYVTAARALGYKSFRIVVRHILPNVMAPVIVISAANFAAAILIESGLSFLGLGVQPPTPSWGGMIKDHYNYIVLGKPYLALIPGLAIMSLVMAFMLMGNALRDALDVKT